MIRRTYPIILTCEENNHQHHTRMSSQYIYIWCRGSQMRTSPTIEFNFYIGTVLGNVRLKFKMNSPVRKERARRR